MMSFAGASISVVVFAIVIVVFGFIGLRFAPALQGLEKVLGWFYPFSLDGHIIT